MWPSKGSLVTAVLFWGALTPLLFLAIITGVVVFAPSVRTAVGLDHLLIRGYQVGQRVDVPGDWFTGQRVTVILFSRSSCPVCQAAKPSLRQVSNLATHSPDARMIIVTAAETIGDELTFASEVGISPDAVFGVAHPTDVRVRVIPTVLVVNRKGRILFTKEGIILQDEDLGELRRLLSEA